jgi:hypothetical protein
LLAASVIFILRPVEEVLPSVSSAGSFVDSIGVNTHLGYFDTAYGNYPLIKEKLTALGVRHARDGAVLTNDPSHSQTIYGRYKDLNTSLGIEFDLIVDPRTENLDSIDAEKTERIAEMAGDSLGSFEGPNEYDHSGSDDWVSTLRDYQERLYTAGKANGSTKDVPVIGPSLTSEEAYTMVGDLSAYIDYGNIHNYYGGRNPGTDGWGMGGYGSLEWNLNNARRYAWQTKPTISTETGYHTLVPSTNGHNGTPEEVEGRYLPRLYLEHFNRGIPRTYHYELIDEKPDPDLQDPEQHFGLLRNDGTEKPAFAALKNLIGLLEDPGPSFTLHPLNYSISGGDTDLHRTLLQKRDGSFYLLLWVEKSSWDPILQQQSSVPTQSITLTFNEPVGQVSTYLPNNSPSPTAQHEAPRQLTLDVPDHPLIVEITPATF